MCSTNEALTAAGYTTAPSPSYGCKLILRDGEPVGHFDAIDAWDLSGVRAAGESIDIEADRGEAAKVIEADRPLIRAGAGRAHKARGTSAPITPEGIAAFLAATAR